MVIHINISMIHYRDINVLAVIIRNTTLILNTPSETMVDVGIFPHFLEP